MEVVKLSFSVIIVGSNSGSYKRKTNVVMSYEIGDEYKEIN